MIVQFVCVNVSQCNNTFIMEIKITYSNVTFLGDTAQTHKHETNDTATENLVERQEKLRKNYTQFLVHSKAFRQPKKGNVSHMCMGVCVVRVWMRTVGAIINDIKAELNWMSVCC